jgi:hypothetical protein
MGAGRVVQEEDYLSARVRPWVQTPVLPIKKKRMYIKLFWWEEESKKNTHIYLYLHKEMRKNTQKF